ncbi:actin-related protein 2/3 complex subunit 5, partial [Suillus plorans]
LLLEGELYDTEPRDPAQVLSDAKQKQEAVRSTLAKEDIPGALEIALDSTPYGPNDEEAKATLPLFVVSILNSMKSSEIINVVKALSQDDQDTLMKYFYKGMGMPGWCGVS